MSLFLGLDIGTQGAKAVVYDANKKCIASRGSHSYGLIETRVLGRAEQHPSTWIQGGISAVHKALQTVNAQHVKAIAVSGQQHGLVALNRNGQLASFTASKILWLKNNEPEIYSQLAQVLLPHDYLNYYLTGRYVMECGDASGTALLDTAGRCWDRQAMDAIDPKLHTFFPSLIGPNEVVGSVLPAVAAELGLLDGVLVAPGSGDNMMSALGAGAVGPGQMVVSLGTSATLFGKSPVAILDDTGCIAPFCDATGAWLPLLCTLNCTAVMEEVCSLLGRSHDQLTELAAAEPPGCDGVNFLPYLAGERTPNWPHASGGLFGLRSGGLRPGVLYRAAMEGVTFGLLAGLRRMEALGLTPTELRVVGGGSQNPLWRQMIADTFQLPLLVPLEPESAALGAALQAAAVHCGMPVEQFVMEHTPPTADEVVHPNPGNREAYKAAFKRHCDLGSQLFGTR